MKKLVIFDLDGTLLNTISDLGESVNWALEQMNLPTHPISAYNYMVGNGVRRLIERAHTGADAELLSRLYELFRQHYDQHCCDKTEPYPGIHELLHQLRGHDVDIAVATNKYQAAAEKIITHYFPDIEFAVIAGQKEGIPVKPDPSVIFGILSERPTPKSEVMMVGDSAVDIETAARACIESIGVTWGFRPVSELRRAHANHLVSRPEEILDHLEDPF